MMRLPTVTAILTILLTAAATAQEGTARRTGQGTLLETVDGVERFAENSGWDNEEFVNPHWAVVYDVELGGGEPWAVVLQGDRTNAGFTASANKLVLDLNGYQYNIDSYQDAEFVPGLLSINDVSGSGSYLRVTGGVLQFKVHPDSRMNVGDAGHAGKLFVDHANVEGSQIHVGGAPGSPGEIVLEAGGGLTLSGSASTTGLYVGSEADGALFMNGPGSFIDATHIHVGNPGQANGTIVLNDPSALVEVQTLTIANQIPSASGDPLGLIINDGRVEVGDVLNLENTSGSSYGEVWINGGTLQLTTTNMIRANDNSRLFLDSGELALGSVQNVSGNAVNVLHWKNGTVRYTAPSVFLREVDLDNLTRQGAALYGGGRAEGTVAAGQTLAFDGDGTLHDGTFTLAGGTIHAGDALTIYENATLEGYGTIDATLTSAADGAGPGTINSSEASNSLAIGALGGANTLTGVGEIVVGHLGLDATYSGTATGTGGFRKVGGGTQTVAGSLGNDGGIFIDDGSLAINGVDAALTGPALDIAAGGRLEILDGANGLVTGTLANEGAVAVDSGSLTVGGGLVNNGWITNNGHIDANIAGSGGITGNGTYTGAIDILGGAILAPGNSVGTLHADSLALGGGGELEFEISAAEGLAGTDWDLTEVGGALEILATAGDPFTIAVTTLGAAGSPGPLADFDPTLEYSWRIIAANVPDLELWTPDLFAIDASGFANPDVRARGEFIVSSASDGMYLNYAGLAPAAVPEPESWCLLIVVGLLAWVVHRGARVGRAETSAFLGRPSTAT